MTQENLNKILADHKLWLAGEEGSCANLRCADLSRANLSSADLSGASLSCANLSCADLSGAIGLPSACDWMGRLFERTDAGYIVYKTFGGLCAPPETWKIEPDSVISENVMFDRCINCGSGINVAPLDWVRKNCKGEIWKCLIEVPWLAGVVVPYNTDGKIRCERVRLLEKVA